MVCTRLHLVHRPFCAMWHVKKVEGVCGNVLYPSTCGTNLIYGEEYNVIEGNGKEYIIHL